MAPQPFPFEYRARPPTPALERFVESLWFARGTVPYARERIAPTGSTVAVFVLGDPIEVRTDNGRGARVRTARGFVIGPHDRPVVNEPLGETHALGVVATPVGCEALFGFPPARLRGSAAPIDELWPAGSALRDAVGDEGPEALLDRLQQTLVRHLAPAPSGLARCRQAVALLEADPTRSIVSVARQLGVSHGHLHRELTRIVGLPPRALARLLRMRRLLAAIDPWSPTPWAQRAAEFGWFDQAHLIRDFKRHTGVTPSAYVRAQRATYPQGEGVEPAGFVPDDERREKTVQSPPGAAERA